jgi:glycosyltransferase involved in cell wall biosynthesis
VNFSVIITCFNRERTIFRAIQSVIDQSYQNFEIIVVDDDSSDNSVNIISSVQDSRLRLICHTFNQGQNAALNTGLQHANFDYVTFLDSDDIWLPDYLLKMRDLFYQKPELDFGYGFLEGHVNSVIRGSNKYAEVLNQGYLSSMITLCVKKEYLQRINDFDIRYTICQDDDICMRLAKEGKFELIEEPIARVIGDTNSMTLNRIKLATGWDFFYHNYKRDIIRYCGYNTWGKHLVKLSENYYRASLFEKALYYSIIGNFLVFTFENRFGEMKYYNNKVLIKSFKRCLKKLFLMN